MEHDLLLHDFDVPLEVCVISLSLLHAVFVDHQPGADDEGGDGDGDGEIYPELDGDDWAGA